MRVPDGAEVLRQCKPGSMPSMTSSRIASCSSMGRGPRRTWRRRPRFKGDRLRMSFPQGRRKTRTVIKGLRMSGMMALTVLERPINASGLKPYVARVLELRRADIVIMDNPRATSPPGCAQRLRPPATLLLLPPAVRTPTSWRRRSPARRRCCTKPPSAPPPDFGTPSAQQQSFRTRPIATSNLRKPLVSRMLRNWSENG